MQSARHCGRKVRAWINCLKTSHAEHQTDYRQRRDHSMRLPLRDSLIQRPDLIDRRQAMCVAIRAGRKPVTAVQPAINQVEASQP